MIAQSINYSRYSRGFNLNKGVNKTSSPKNLIQTIETIIPISFKIILQFLFSSISIIPLTIFNVKLDSKYTKNGGNVVLTKRCDYNFLKDLRGKPQINLELNKFSWKIKTNGAISYATRKLLFFKKTSLFSGYIFKLSDLLYLNILGKFFNNFFKLVNSFRVESFIKQVN